MVNKQFGLKNNNNLLPVVVVDFRMIKCTDVPKEKEADRRRGGKTISKSGQEWTSPAQLGQLKTGQDGKGLLQIHLWCPDDLPRLWDRIE